MSKFSAVKIELVCSAPLRLNQYCEPYISSLYQRVLYFILYNFIPQPNHDFMSGEAITDQCVIMTHLCGPFHFISRAGSRPQVVYIVRELLKVSFGVTLAYSAVLTYVKSVPKTYSHSRPFTYKSTLKILISVKNSCFPIFGNCSNNRKFSQFADPYNLSF